MTVTVFGYLILISIDFLQSNFSVFFLVLASIDEAYQTLKTVLDRIFKHLKIRQKYSVTYSSRHLEMWSNTIFRV